MKHDAIVEQGIPIHERVPIPEEMIPADSRVEIDAKIQAGYCKFNAPAHMITQSALVPPEHYLQQTGSLLPDMVLIHTRSYYRSCHVHGRARECQGPWLGGH